ncbi:MULTISPECIES: TonB-dependent receptor [unclassified Brevundimonas]|uniref:TonB-dependent receptor n=1 Tax=unclassified Brevundimonas TaxID=2622653 RepID=UPI001FD83158|nr:MULTISPECIES: TonB-dependent receptor [unclassified Brevundimonas]
MKTRTFRERLLRSTMFGGAALMALTAAPAVVMLTPSIAEAQDYTAGTLSGTVQSTSGAPVAGAAVSIVSNQQGIVRQATTDASGRFRVPLIPTGGYTVTVNAPGYNSISDNVQVRLGGESGYVFTVASADADATTVADVVVTGVRRSLDFTQTTAGAVLDVQDLTNQLPIARNITAVTLLAPGAVAGDSAFGVATAQFQTPPSLSGASVAENAYFVNGLNTTNFVNGLGGAGVPFEFYKTVEVKTGGYSAEFGRATGGVINAVTKSGTNDFIVELHGTWAPDSLRSDAPNTYLVQNSVGEFEEKTFTAEVGGPILRDRLFAYGIVSWADTESAVATTSGTYSRDTWSKDPFYGIKLDGYITPDHRLEATYWNTERTRTRQNYSFDPTTNTIGDTPLSTATQFQGGDNWVARYTGNFTDWLTLSAAYGESNQDLAAFNNLRDEALVQDARTNPSSPTRVSRQSAAATNLPFETERKFWRADADLYFDFFGQHHVRLGYDKEETLLTQTSTRNGDRNYVYRTAGATNTLGLAPGTEYIDTRVFVAGGGFAGVNEALYIQDSWDVTDRLNVQLGLRQDKFEVQDPNGTPFVSFDNEIGPRLGFSYDLTGDARSKLFGSYGRYFLPIASNTAFRIASPAIDFNEYFRGNGPGGTIGALDPVTGLPTAGLGPQITNATGASSLQPCPPGLGAISTSGAACSIRDDGTSTPPEFISAQNLKSTYEDEFRLGYQLRVNDEWTVGIGGTYRKLGRVVEDALLDQAVVAYCQREGIPLVIGDPDDPSDGAGCAEIYNGQHYYLIINPGSDVVATLPDIFEGETTNRTVTLSAQDLRLPKARREYSAIEFTFERAFDGVWGLQGSYVISKSEGNYEGAVKSDLGQTDAGIVTDFDFLVFLPGQQGLLPNHRGHQFKLFGSWQATQNLLIGANFSLTSPRPYGCLGNAPAGYLDADVANNGYGAISRFCGGVVVDRGTAFETDWVDRLDLSFRYSVPTRFTQNLVFRADVFNVFNRRNVTEANEFGEVDGGGIDPEYRSPIAYQAPRSVRIGFDLAF